MTPYTFFGRCQAALQNWLRASRAASLGLRLLKRGSFMAIGRVSAEDYTVFTLRALPQEPAKFGVAALEEPNFKQTISHTRRPFRGAYCTVICLGSCSLWKKSLSSINQVFGARE